MRLKSLKLEQYRNYEALNLDFSPERPVTSIIGPNAQGKTNILEAIYLLALTKSFRTRSQQDLIQWEKDYCRVTGRFEAGGEQRELEIFFGNPPQPARALKVNGVKTSSVKFIGNCQIVFFHPEDLNMLYLGPDLRRRYLDVLNIQVNPRYYAALRGYKRVLQQRNALLKRIKEGQSAEGDLDVWDQQLASHGNILIAEREKTARFLQERLSEAYRRITQGSEVIETEYRCALSGAKSLEEALAGHRRRDLEAQFTTVGPHRDDIIFQLNHRVLESHASRGEYRSLLLAIKLLELTFYEEKTGEKPILLLDDVFSELDETRQAMLLEMIEGHQAILTATHMEQHLGPREHRGIKRQCFELKEGRLAPG